MDKQENIQTDWDWLDNESAPDFIEELRECAGEIVMENPGIDKEEWIDTLLRQFPCEVVDAYGTDEQEVYQALSHLWETELADPVPVPIPNNRATTQTRDRK